ncbi:MAG: ATP synthase F1 subunit gamma [Anaerovoracaceae bacterium]|jgi:F-type H+-transporting ATPase subunit gamma
MAEHMQALKRQIQSISSTERVTNAMKLVAASKLRRARAVYEHNSAILKKIAFYMRESFDRVEDVPVDLLDGGREVHTTCYVVITASMGFCGSYNGNIIRETERLIEESKHDVKLVTVGSKGEDHFSRMDYELIHTHSESPDTVPFSEIVETTDDLLRRYREHDIDEIVLIFTSYINPLKQDVVVERILPFTLPEKEKDQHQMMNSVEYMPSPREVYSYLAEKYVEMTLYNAIIEAATCEYAARRSAMENATDNANDMLDDLNQRYSRARQASITNEIIEVVSGSEAQTS